MAQLFDVGVPDKQTSENIFETGELVENSVISKMGTTTTLGGCKIYENMAYEDRNKKFEQYLASGEPEVKERAINWSMAIGLQDVDRLKPSEFLLEQAKANIEGRISSEEVGKRLEEYYSQKLVREKAEADGTFEADRVADRINLLLEERAFTFSPMELSRIHGFLFKGVLPHAGQYRTYNITKNQ